MPLNNLLIGVISSAPRGKEFEFNVTVGNWEVQPDPKLPPTSYGRGFLRDLGGRVGNVSPDIFEGRGIDAFTMEGVGQFAYIFRFRIRLSTAFPPFQRIEAEFQGYSGRFVGEVLSEDPRSVVFVGNFSDFTTTWPINSERQVKIYWTPSS